MSSGFWRVLFGVAALTLQVALAGCVSQTSTEVPCTNDELIYFDLVLPEGVHNSSCVLSPGFQDASLLLSFNSDEETMDKFLQSLGSSISSLKTNERAFGEDVLDAIPWKRFEAESHEFFGYDRRESPHDGRLADFVAYDLEVYETGIHGNLVVIVQALQL